MKRWSKLITTGLLIGLLSGCATHHIYPHEGIFNIQEIKADSDNVKFVIFREDKLRNSGVSWILSSDDNNLAEISSGTHYVLATHQEKTLLKAYRISRSRAIPIGDIIGATLLMADNVFRAVETENVVKEDLALLEGKVGKVYFYKLEVHNEGFTGVIPKLVKVEKNEAINFLEGSRRASLFVN